MSWFSENKFMGVFGGIMAVGVAGLGYLTYSASGSYDTARSEYESAAEQLKSLQGSKPAPSEENLKAYKAEQASLKQKIDALQKDLSAMQIARQSVSATGFQDRLKEEMTKLTTAAQEKEMTLPTEKFYLGFEDYQSKPPKDSAAPALLKQLQAVVMVVDMLLPGGKGTTLQGITRHAVKEEGAETPKDEKKGAKGGNKENKNELIAKESFQIKFITGQENFRRILNDIASNKSQLLVVRKVEIKNEKSQPPAKQPAGAANGGGGTAPGPAPADTPPNPVPGPTAAPAGSTATPAPAGTAAPAPAAAVPGSEPRAAIETIFGNELLNVTLHIDILDVEAPPAPALEKSSGNKSSK